jgi:hypothetical protein
MASLPWDDEEPIIGKATAGSGLLKNRSMRLDARKICSGGNLVPLVGIESGAKRTSSC